MAEEKQVKRGRGRPRKNTLGPKNAAMPEVFGRDFVELVKRYKATGEADYPVLDKDQERELIFQFKDNPEELKKRLILHNIKMVFDMAKKYAVKSYDFDDMVARGMYGLTLAAEKFNPEKNIKFSTYCYAWIFKYVVKEFYDKDFAVISKSTSIDVPLNEESEENGRSFDNMLTETAIDPTCGYSSLEVAAMPNSRKQIAQERLKKITAEISNFVNTSSEFTPKDRTIYDRIMLGSEPIKDVARSERLSANYVNSRIAYISDAIRKMLKEAYDVDDMDGIYALPA